jgi:hypothetical protein
MTPYCGYAIYDVQRTRTRVKQLEIDAQAGRLAAALAALWRSLTNPVRAHGPSRFNNEQRLDRPRRDSGGMPASASRWRAPR